MGEREMLRRGGMNSEFGVRNSKFFDVELGPAGVLNEWEFRLHYGFAETRWRGKHAEFGIKRRWGTQRRRNRRY